MLKFNYYYRDQKINRNLRKFKRDFGVLITLLHQILL